jgi:hypothetical protein
VAAEASVAAAVGSAVGVVELVEVEAPDDVVEASEEVEDAGVDDPSDGDDVGGGVLDAGVAELVVPERLIDWKLTPD